jgi:hypothetical protein
MSSKPTEYAARQLTFKETLIESNKENYSICINDIIYSMFYKAIQAEFSNLTDAAVLITPSKVADYQCNSAMSIANV